MKTVPCELVGELAHCYKLELIAEPSRFVPILPYPIHRIGQTSMFSFLRALLEIAYIPRDLSLTTISGCGPAFCLIDTIHLLKPTILVPVCCCIFPGTKRTDDIPAFRTDPFLGIVRHHAPAPLITLIGPVLLGRPLLPVPCLPPSWINLK